VSWILLVSVLKVFYRLFGMEGSRNHMTFVAYRSGLKHDPFDYACFS